MKKSFSIALSCAIGAGLGTMCAVAFGAFWFLGLLLGGVVGYFIYEFDTVIKAIPKAWKHAKSRVVLFKYTEKAKSAGKWMIEAFGGLLYTFPYIFFLVDSADSNTNLPVVLLLLPFVALTAGISTFAISLFFKDTTVLESESSEKDSSSFEKSMEQIERFAKGKWWKSATVVLFAPLFALYPSFFVLRKVMAWVLKIVKGIFVFFFTFLWKLFKLIHSDVRLLVGIDSIIGGGVGFYFESPMVGMISGAVFGFVNYYFVSIRILKLKPTH